MTEDLQQSDAENSELAADAAQAASGEAATPEVVETDEQKNTRIQEEAAAAAAKREEKRQSTIQRRMDELTADKYAERKRADELATQNARILALLEGKQAAPAASGEPTREQFESYEDFVTARAEYRAEARATQAAQAAIEQFTKSQKEQQAAASRETAEATEKRQFLERRAVIEKALPDYREVVEAWEPNLPDAVARIIVQHPEGPLISYHLAKSPQLQAQFHGQSSDMQGVLLGQLLATLKGSAKETSAPPPGKPVVARAASSDGEYTGDPEGYYAWRSKRDKR